MKGEFDFDGGQVWVSFLGRSLAKAETQILAVSQHREGVAGDWSQTRQCRRRSVGRGTVKARLWGRRCHRWSGQRRAGKAVEDGGAGDCQKPREGVKSSCGWAVTAAKVSRSAPFRTKHLHSFRLVGGLPPTPQGPSLNVPSSLEPLSGRVTSYCLHTIITSYTGQYLNCASKHRHGALTCIC